MAASLFIYNFEHVQRINLCCCWKFSVIQPPTAVPLRRDYVRIVILKNTTKSTRRHLHRISILYSFCLVLYCISLFNVGDKNSK